MISLSSAKNWSSKFKAFWTIWKATSESQMWSTSFLCSKSFTNLSESASISEKTSCEKSWSLRTSGRNCLFTTSSINSSKTLSAETCTSTRTDTRSRFNTMWPYCRTIFSRSSQALVQKTKVPIPEICSWRRLKPTSPSWTNSSWTVLHCWVRAIFSSPKMWGIYLNWTCTSELIPNWWGSSFKPWRWYCCPRPTVWTW